MRIIELHFKVKRPILACGADLKGAFALAEGNRAWLFDGFGDLADLDNFTRYGKAVRASIKKLNIRPEVIACDLHPGYHSTQFAESLSLKANDSRAPLRVPYRYYSLVRIQHHEAHIASAIVDNSTRGDCIGVAFDGTGYGSDGNIWGGEFFAGKAGNFKRVAHFEYMQMPGGEAAIREPWRMAASYLYRTFGADFLKLKIDFVKELDKKKWAVLKRMMAQDINSPLTSSAGRLFDAVASIVLSKNEAAFEAELPIELEKLAIELCRDRYGFEIMSKNWQFSIDHSGALRGIVKDISAKVDKATISSRFHNTIAGVILEVCKKLHKKHKMNNVVLSGGVFQNKYLTAKTGALLKTGGLNVYMHSKVPTNDSGIPIGQIAIANSRVRCA